MTALDQELRRRAYEEVEKKSLSRTAIRTASIFTLCRRLGR